MMPGPNCHFQELVDDYSAFDVTQSISVDRDIGSPRQYLLTQIDDFNPTLHEKLAHLIATSHMELDES